jgi:hypothetical protein
MSVINCPNGTRTRFSGYPDYFIKGLAPEDGYYNTDKWKKLFGYVYIPAYLNGQSWILRNKTIGSDGNLMQYGSMIEYINYKTVRFPADVSGVVDKIFTEGINTLIIWYANYSNFNYRFIADYVLADTKKYIGLELTNRYHLSYIEFTMPDGSTVRLTHDNGEYCDILEFGSANLYILLIWDKNNRLGSVMTYGDIDIINAMRINGEPITSSGFPSGAITIDYLGDLVSKHMLYDSKLTVLTSEPALREDSKIVMITHENLYNKVGTMAYDAFGSDVIGDAYLLRSGLSILVPDMSKYPCFKIIGLGKDTNTLIDEWMLFACRTTVTQQPQVQAGQLPSWLIPALIIGGGIGIGALAYYLYKKR